MQSNKLISIIIPHLNQPTALEVCLGSLERQTLERSEFEVIVVDNGSSGGLEWVVARYPNIRLLQELKPGPGLARNRGIEAASGECLAFIDADCRAHPDWLRNAVRSLQSAPERTILGWRRSNLA